MRTFASAALAALSLRTAFALPQQQLVFQDTQQLVQEASSSILADLVHEAADALHKVEHALEDLSAKTGILSGTSLTNGKHGVGIMADTTGFEVVTSQEFPDYRMRIKSGSLCDPNVKQFSGYLDVSDKKSLFFWYFDSRSKPDSDPLMLWMNGGPGCSSTTGLLFELGPCTIQEGGNSTVLNKYSWTELANMVFLDQPINVGFSYGPSGAVSDTDAAAADAYAFLQLFYKRFPKFADHDFYMAAESYGGKYVPTFSRYIFDQNLELGKSLKQTERVHIPLSAILIGNGLTEPFTQYGTYADYACAPSKYAVYDEATCDSVRSATPRCQNLIKACYNSESRLACVPAALYCNNAIDGPFRSTGKCIYDIRMTTDNPMCYEQLDYIETFMNQPHVKAELGAKDDLTFKSCNMDINRDFLLHGDWMHNAARHLPDMLAAGIRTLIYAGEMDYICQFMGNKAWVGELESKFQTEWLAADDKKWITKDGQHAGTVKTAGPGAGNLTFIQVFEAGHMVPFDQPAAALDMVERWIKNKPYAEKA